MEQTRKPYLTNNALKYFLTASVLTMAINQLNTTADGIIVSHLVGPDALSAVTLYVPINLMVSALGTLLGIGATIIAAKAIGRRDKEAVCGILSTALISLVLAGICLFGAGFIFGEEITGILTSDEHLRPQVLAYLSVMLGLGFMPMINLFLGQCVDIDGFPLKVTKAMMLLFATNVLFDFTLVGAFNMGIRGSAIATIIAYFIAILYYCRHLLGGQSDIHFHFSFTSFKKYIGQNLKQGLPLLIGNMILVLLFYYMNNIVQDRLGHNGMFIMSVCVNIFMIGMMLSNGFGSAILSLGGFLYGQSDFTSVRFLVKRCLIAILIITIGFSVLVEAAPSLLTRLFGANTPELITLANSGVRIFIICLAPFCLAITLANLYQVLSRLVLSTILVISFPVVLLSSMKLLANNDNDTMLWYAFPISGIIVFLYAVIVTEVIRIKSRPKKFTSLTLLPMENLDQVYEISLNNTTSNFHETIGHLSEMMDVFVLDETIKNQAVSGTEEILLNTIQHSGIEGNGHYSDLRMVKTAEIFTISLKYEGRPFNPLILNEDDRKIGLRILFGQIKDVDYKYMYGQNMMYLSWNIEKDNTNN